MLQQVNGSISPQDLRARIFRGDILHFTRLPEILEFCRLVRQICELALRHQDPPHSYDSHDHDNWTKRIYSYQLEARDSPVCRRLFFEAVQSLGLELKQTFCDRFIFRAVPPINSSPAGTHGWVDIHRDTWGAGIYQQINWWGPVYPYLPGTGIEFYPQYFQAPIANTSAKWSYERYKDARRLQTPELKPYYKSIPCLLKKPRGEPIKPLLHPGDLLCFSAAHLHGSSINRSDASRFSFETRTVNLDDIESGLKAPNLDNDSTHQLLQLFHNMVDGSSLLKTHF